MALCASTAGATNPRTGTATRTISPVAILLELLALLLIEAVLVAVDMLPPEQSSEH